jgi:hypothetical protein
MPSLSLRPRCIIASAEMSPTGQKATFGEPNRMSALFPGKRTSESCTVMSALGQKRTSVSFIGVRSLLKMQSHAKTECLAAKLDRH